MPKALDRLSDNFKQHRNKKRKIEVAQNEIEKEKALVIRMR
jgi:hypothetical protein